MELQIFDELLVRANTDLAALIFDETVSLERVSKCQSAAADLESAVREILTEEWIPRSISDLNFSIASVSKNLRRVESDIDDCICDVIARERPDEYYRVWVAIASARLLEFELDVLMTALAEAVMSAPQNQYVN